MAAGRRRRRRRGWVGPPLPRAVCLCVCVCVRAVPVRNAGKARAAVANRDLKRPWTRKQERSGGRGVRARLPCKKRRNGETERFPPHPRPFERAFRGGERERGSAGPRRLATRARRAARLCRERTGVGGRMGFARAFCSLALSPPCFRGKKRSLSLCFFWRPPTRFCESAPADRATCVRVCVCLCARGRGGKTKEGAGLPKKKKKRGKGARENGCPRARAGFCVVCCCSGELPLPRPCDSFRPPCDVDRSIQMLGHERTARLSVPLSSSSPPLLLRLKRPPTTAARPPRAARAP